MDDRLLKLMDKSVRMSHEAGYFRGVVEGLALGGMGEATEIAKRAIESYDSRVKKQENPPCQS